MYSSLGIGVLVYSIMVGALVSYDGFMLSSVKNEGGPAPAVRLPPSKFGDGEWMFGRGGCSLGVIINHTLP